MTLQQRVQQALNDADFRDKLRRIPTVSPVRSDGTVEVWLQGWTRITDTRMACVSLLKDAGFTVVRSYEEDLGDEDCFKMCGFVVISA